MKIALAIIIVVALAGGCFWLTRYLATDKPEQVTSDFISLNVLCNGEKQCVYQGQDLNINLIITNTSDDSIALPMTYLSQRGPSITLVNNDTEKRITLPTGPDDRSLLSDQRIVGAGQTARLSWLLKNADIREVAGDTVNIIANVSLPTTVYHDGTSTEEATNSSFSITH